MSKYPFIVDTYLYFGGLFIYNFNKLVLWERSFLCVPFVTSGSPDSREDKFWCSEWDRDSYTSPRP